ncbi:uncharacterized protein LOC135390375 [Ornithodoros turicata]|uniref:uncharacterized protein LOC135390375 n=1 Tax=Ornithodoros turicata TaxID=34597 RepID=UPI003139FB32
MGSAISGTRLQLGRPSLCCREVSFHRFPKDGTQFKKWIIAIKRDEGPDFSVTKYTKWSPTSQRHSCAKGSRKPPKQRAAPLLPRSPAAQSSQAQEPTETVDVPTEEYDIPITDSDMNGDNSIEPAFNAPSTEGQEHLLSIIVGKDQEILKFRDKCSALEEQLTSARAATHELRAQNESLACQLDEEKQRTSNFSLEKFKHSDEDIMLYTGLPCYEQFMSLMEFLDPGERGCNVLRTEGSSSTTKSTAGRKRKLSVEDELFLVLVRLRLGLLEADLGHRFCVTQSAVSRICTSWINFMYAKLCTLPLWAPREVIDATMPIEFLHKYASTRVILDATEIRC